MGKDIVEQTGEENATAEKRILLVDDDNEIIESLRYALQAQGYEILIASRWQPGTGDG